MWKMVWPILMIVGSNCFYHICTKSMPEEASAFGSLMITYLVGAVFSAVLFFVSIKPAEVITEISKINWTSFILGLSIVGLEAGYVFMYRAGWKVSNGALTANICLAVALLVIGVLLYRESVSIRQLGFSPVLFQAVDANGVQVYHTNVMMHVGTEIAVVCMEAIADPEQRSMVRESLENTGKTIVEITFDQMSHFAGNMLELHNKDGEPCLIMSLSAYNSLSDEQIETLASRMKLITPVLDCIEENGGGSARCMIAEIF